MRSAEAIGGGHWPLLVISSCFFIPYLSFAHTYLHSYISSLQARSHRQTTSFQHRCSQSTTHIHTRVISTTDACRSVQLLLRRTDLHGLTIPTYIHTRAHLRSAASYSGHLATLASFHCLRFAPLWHLPSLVCIRAYRFTRSIGV